jgi:hypothetical protein
MRFAVTLAVLILPATVVAHGGAAASLVVTVDHVEPGSSLTIIASDFGSDSVVQFRIVAPDRAVELGHRTAGPDGHFEATFNLPADFPPGWADLTATGDDGSSTTTQVLVGPAVGATPPRPNKVVPWWQDPSIWLLAALVLGAVLVGVWALSRSRALKGSR